jgi:maleylacetoacetate isomerase
MSKGSTGDEYTLFGSARSSCSFRVRIALNLLGLDYKYEQTPADRRIAPAFRELNPQSLVPLLVGRDVRLSQSIAIMEYLNEYHGGDAGAILPADPIGRARVRSLALYVCCDIQPLQNTRLDESLRSEVSSLAYPLCKSSYVSTIWGTRKSQHAFGPALILVMLVASPLGSNITMHALCGLI